VIRKSQEFKHRKVPAMKKQIALTIVALALIFAIIGRGKKDVTDLQPVVEPTFTLFGKVFTYEDATIHLYGGSLTFSLEGRRGIEKGLNEKETKIVSLFNNFMGNEYGFWDDPCLQFGEITRYMKEEGISFEELYEVIKESPELKVGNPFRENGVLPYAPCLTEECIYDCEVVSHERRFVQDWNLICSALGKNEIMDESILGRVREDLQVLKEKRKDLSQDPPLKFTSQILPTIPESLVRMNTEFPFAWIASKATACVSERAE
jgi:hypothetical protein